MYLPTYLRTIDIMSKFFAAKLRVSLYFVVIRRNKCVRTSHGPHWKSQSHV